MESGSCRAAHQERRGYGERVKENERTGPRLKSEETGGIGPDASLQSNPGDRQSPVLLLTGLELVLYDGFDYYFSPTNITRIKEIMSPINCHWSLIDSTVVEPDVHKTLS